VAKLTKETLSAKADLTRKADSECLRERTERREKKERRERREREQREQSVPLQFRSEVGLLNKVFN